MGHVRLGALPKTREWRRVVELLELGADTAEIAGAVAVAAEKDFAAAQSDPALTEVIWLLTQLPLAARSNRFAAELTALGFPPGSENSLLEIIGGLSCAVEVQVGNAPGRTDLGELARHAAAESLSEIIGSQTPSLFGDSSEDARIELAKFATKDRFAQLARDFFARLTNKTLDYYVSRVLAEHVGPDRAYETLHDKTRFQRALALHCRETSEIVEQFAGGWYSKSNFQGTLTRESTKRFGSYALKKMRDELRARRGNDA
ncbi:MAG: hypothetical protein JXQ99_00270 [Hyphomicrobiaceae bacterium]